MSALLHVVAALIVLNVHFSLIKADCTDSSSKCDGECDCDDCSDENFCSDDTEEDNGMSSAAIIGIIVAGVCLLLILIVALIAFIVFRRRHGASKTPRRRRDANDLRTLQNSGHGLPVDIPVEALAREPPPRYTSVDDLSTEISSPTGSERRSTQRNSSASTHQPPPPYCEISVVSNGSVTQQSSSHLPVGSEAPPQYHSQTDVSRTSPVDLQTSSPRVRPRAGTSHGGRQRSIDSFMEFPSMSDILLTSSRSSIPTSPSDSQGQGGVGSISTGGEHSASGRSRSDSAHGASDSLYSSSPSSPTGNGIRRGRHRQRRSTSLTDIATAHGGSGSTGHEIPECGIQRRVRRMKEATGRASRPSSDELDEDQSHGSSGDRDLDGSLSGETRRYSKHRRQSAEQNASSAAEERRRRHGQRQRVMSRSLTQMETLDEDRPTLYFERVPLGSPV